MSDQFRPDKTANDVIFTRAKARVDREEMLFYGLSVGFLLLALLLYTFPSVKMVHQVYKEQKLKTKERALAAEYSRLKLQYEVAISPEEMEKQASKGGFVPSGKNRVVYVEKTWSGK
ncbi:MAG: hypothetical protein HY280_03415 [Nitrospinae bacterium]|nr:hypothetical protein [Nitrospinota bacterium]